MDRALEKDDPSLRPKAPGMKYRHYAPKAQMLIVAGDARAVAQQINALVKEDLREGRTAGILSSDENAGAYTCGIVKRVGTRQNEITIAEHLYGVLREFDALGVDRIYSEAFETPQMGQAIMNRLIKAAGHRMIRV